MHIFLSTGIQKFSRHILVSDSFFSNISSLIDEPLTYLSNHCQVTTNINMIHYINKSPTGNSNYPWKDLPKSFKWKNTSSPKDFRSALNTPHIKAKIDYFMSNRFSETKDEIENADRLLTNILCEPPGQKGSRLISQKSGLTNPVVKPEFYLNKQLIKLISIPHRPSLLKIR